MIVESTPASDTAAGAYVPETRFGLWFQRTDTWRRYVVSEAMAELRSLLPPATGGAGRLVDLGCGEGVAFEFLQREFGARSILGLDIDAASVQRARQQAARLPGGIEVQLADAARLPLASDSVDLVVCHQLLHHANDPGAVLRECRRVLAPGGWLLVAESCHEFLDWWPVRLLFRHPPRQQPTAEGYVSLVRDAGFHVDAGRVLTPAPFWSQRDLGLRQRLGLPALQRPAAQVRIAAQRAASVGGNEGRLKLLSA